MAAAQRVAELTRGGSGRFNIGLAGGSTPEAMYRMIAEMDDVGWDRIDFWLSDERWVPWTDERSNGAMASRALLQEREVSFHRPPFDGASTPEASAAHYADTLRSIFGPAQPDVVLLGLGADGHTASLFPGSPALNETERIYVANTIPETGERRLTASYPLLWSARHLIVLATGISKAEAVKESFAERTPAGRIAEGGARIEWHLDHESASLL